MAVRVLVGDCRERLKELGTRSIHVVCTSPPYWGLRDYGLPPLVWGGSSECVHEWKAHRQYKDSPTRKGGEGLGFDDADTTRAQRWQESQFCHHCHAWRGSLGLEPTPGLYVAHLVEVMREVRRVLRDDGTCWLNLGDSYAGSTVGGGSGQHSTLVGTHHRQRTPTSVSARVTPSLKKKDLCGIPWRVAFALQADGWWLRSDIIWAKPNCMPESVRDRPTKSHEYLFLLTKRARYYYDADAIKVEAADSTKARAYLGKRPETPKTRAMRDNGMQGAGDTLAVYDRPTRNRRTVWTIATEPYSGSHFAVFPKALVEPCIKAGTSERGVCSACGAGWRRVVEKGELVGEAVIQKTDRPAARVRKVSETSILRTNGRTWRESTTTGWAPGCECDAGEPIPATVIDMFGGSGTVGEVCNELGRDAILCELNPEYVELIEQRCVGLPMFDVCEVG